MNFRRPLGQKPVTGHGEEDAWLPILKDEKHSGHRDDGAEREQSADARQSRDLERPRQWVGDAQLIVACHPREDGADDDVDNRANGQATEDPARHVALRILGLLGRRRDRVEADVGKEDDRGALMNAGPAVRREWMVVLGVDVHQPDDHEECEHDQLHRNHDVVGAGAFANAQHQQPGDE